MNKHKDSVLILGTILAIILLAVISFPHRDVSLAMPTKTERTKTVKTQKNIRKRNSNLPYPDPNDLKAAGSWQEKSESKSHPDLLSLRDLWVRVSIKGNRVYIMDGNKPVYTMLASCGVYHNGKSSTPTGTYAVEAERGANFFNQSLKVGARTYVSWHGHGTYLFHSVPTDENNKIIKSEAQKLGKTQASHGCVRLSIPDSKWLYEKLPTGTKVVIKDK